MRAQVAAIALISTGACSSEHTARVLPVAELPDAAPALYPAGPYQLLDGYVAPDLCFQGYREAKPPLVTICLHDFWDPDGTRGLRAIFIAENAEWCSPCNQLAELLNGLDDRYHARGGRFMTVVAESKKPAGAPADVTTLNNWVTAHHLAVDAAIDPKHSFLPPGNGIPTMYVIDPRTMRIVRVNAGLDFAKDAAPVGFEELLVKNGG